MIIDPILCIYIMYT